MPQLDTLTFINQFIWFIISFVCLYIYIENLVLPKLSIIFKTRNWNIFKSKNIKLNEKKNLKEIISISNLNMMENYYNNVNLNSNNWFNSEIKDLKNIKLNDLNSTYITEVENYILTKRTTENNIIG